jgi:hypothetical protein
MRFTPVPVKLADRTVDLRPGDFLILRKVSGGMMEIKHFELDYRRLMKAGLVRHRFGRDKGDWPIARAELTDDGKQALAADPHAGAYAA